MQMQILREEFSECSLCALHLTRNKLVFGEGNTNNRILIIGEGPGKEEDRVGRPFVGRSGQLLTEAIEITFNKPRSESVYITNIVKCRPTVDNKMIKDRPPLPDEVTKCTPILLAQINVILPKVIISLGASALNALLKTKVSITKMRGKPVTFSGFTLLPTFHPSYVVRNGGKSGALWNVFLQDIQYAATLSE